MQTLNTTQKEQEITGNQLKEIQEKFSHDKFAALIGATIKRVADGYAMCTLPVTENLYNAVGGIMGGVYFTLIDFTFAVASNWNKPATVSLSSSISFLAPAKGTELIAEAKCVKEGKNTCYYLIDIYDNTGAHLTSATMNGYIKR